MLLDKNSTNAILEQRENLAVRVFGHEKCKDCHSIALLKVRYDGIVSTPQVNQIGFSILSIHKGKIIKGNFYTGKFEEYTIDKLEDITMITEYAIKAGGKLKMLLSLQELMDS